MLVRHLHPATHFAHALREVDKFVPGLKETLRGAAHLPPARAGEDHVPGSNGVTAERRAMIWGMGKTMSLVFPVCTGGTAEFYGVRIRNLIRGKQ